MPTESHAGKTLNSAKAQMASTFKAWSPKHTLISILLLGFIQGALYVLLIPPWWHYDEPGNFEMGWLMANRSGWPQAGEQDEAMRRELARSLRKYDWYKFRNYQPDLSSDQPIWIGAGQFSGQPGYYFLISLPLRLLRNADFTAQYHAARLTSFFLFMLIITVVWMALGEIFPGGHPLRWMVTAFIASLPAFVDEMISVNDDVSGVLAACIFLWASFRLIRSGVSAGRLLGFGLSLALCYLSKNTTWYAFLIAPFVLIFGFLRGRFAGIVWAVTAIGLLAGALITLDRGNPAHWYQDRTQAPPLRLQTDTAPHGKYAFQLDYSGGRRPEQIGQILNPQWVSAARGETLTFGAWIWADQPMQAQGPSVRFASAESQFVVRSTGLLSLDADPTFYRVIIDVPARADYAIVIPPSPVEASTKTRIYFDGIILAEGEYSAAPPQYTDALGTQGNWDGHAFRNLIRNGSAEHDGLRIRPWADRLFNFGYGDPAFILSTLQDWQGTGWYYRDTASTLFRTFWASVAGDKVNLPGNYAKVFLAPLTFIGLLGACRLLWRKRKILPWDILYILGMALALAWTIAAARGIASLLAPAPLFPWARYAYPAIIPTALLLCAGWWEWLDLLKEKFQFTDAATNAIFLSVITGLAAVVITNVVQVFHPEWWSAWGTLVIFGLFQAVAYWIILNLMPPSKS